MHRRILRLAIAACAMTASSASAQSQFQWIKMTATSSTAPIGRMEHAMAYDSARAETILFGGFNGAHLGDTWAYDAAGWRQLSPATVPPARSQHAMAYDPTRERIVLIGGTDGTDFDDTWEWDGTDWSLVASGVRGLAPDGAAAFDPTLGGVLFNIGTTNMKWNGTSWSTLAVTKPLGGTHHGMVYDAASGGILTLDSQYTRRFRAGIGWQDLHVATLFSRERYAMAIDPANARPVFHGGRGAHGSSFGSANDDTWQWVGGAWVEIQATGPQYTANCAMVFDLSRRVFVLYGGLRGGTGSTYLKDTWELVELQRPASYGTFGQACAGTSSYLPMLQPDPIFNSKPILGGTFIARIDGLPSAQPVTGLLGASNQSWNGLPLPLDLGPFGMPGCLAHVSLDVLVPVGLSNGQGIASWMLTIPNSPGLLGANFYQQAFVVAPRANTAGLIWSNGGAGTIGYR